MENSVQDKTISMTEAELEAIKKQLVKMGMMKA